MKKFNRSLLLLLISINIIGMVSVILIFSDRYDGKKTLIDNIEELQPAASLIQRMIRENITKLKSPNKAHRRIAAAKLGSLKAREAVPLLTQIVLDDEDRNLVRVSLKALSNIDGENSIDLFIGKLDHRDIDVRKVAIHSLIKLEKLSSKKKVIGLTKSNESIIVAETFRALTNLSAEGLGAYELSDFSNQIEIALSGEDSRTKTAALQLLAKYPSGKTLTRLCQAIRQQELDTVQMQAARSLRVFSGVEAITCLKKAINDQNPQLSCVALGSLIKMGEVESLHNLAAFLNSPDRRVRGIAVMELGSIGTEEVRSILTDFLSRERDFTIHLNTKRLLSKLNGKDG